MWIVDVSGSRLFIAAVTTEHADRTLRRESRRIVGSIRFIPPHMLADVKIAERFMQARNDTDVATAMGLLSKDGATVRMQNGYRTERNMPFVRLDREELALRSRSSNSTRFDISPPDVDGTPIRSSVALRSCALYRMDNTLRRILGHPPVESSISIGVGQNRITHLSFPWLNVSYPSAEPPEFAEFVAWIGAEHPEAGQVYDDGELFQDRGQEPVQALSRTSIDLLGDLSRGVRALDDQLGAVLHPTLYLAWANLPHRLFMEAIQSPARPPLPTDLGGVRPGP